MKDARCPDRSHPSTPDFLDVTEVAGEMVSQEQIDRAARRYAWAGSFCDGRDVLEVACGTGPGLGILLKHARTLYAGDVSQAMVDKAASRYGGRLDVRRMDAQVLPFDGRSLDVVIIFEALYYLENPEAFVRECARVLRPGGLVLVSTANKDLFDFNPSPYSNVYHGVRELGALFLEQGFEPSFWGDTPVHALSLRQRILRPLKKAVVSLGLMPKTMNGKKLLKRLVFGKMRPFPAELGDRPVVPGELRPVAPGVPDQIHKVILCAARKVDVQPQGAARQPENGRY